MSGNVSDTSRIGGEQKFAGTAKGTSIKSEAVPEDLIQAY